MRRRRAHDGSTTGRPRTAASHSARVAARTRTSAGSRRPSKTPDLASLVPSTRFGASTRPSMTCPLPILGPARSTAARRTARSSAISIVTLTFSTGSGTGTGVGPSYLGGRILASTALERRDEWQESPIVDRDRSIPTTRFDTSVAISCARPCSAKKRISTPGISAGRRVAEPVRSVWIAPLRADPPTHH